MEILLEKVELGRSVKTISIGCGAVLSHVGLCNPIDGSLPGSSLHGILQARVLKWVAMPSSRGSFQPRGWTQVSHIAGGFLPAELPGKPQNRVICLQIFPGFTSFSLQQWDFQG